MAAEHAAMRHFSHKLPNLVIVLLAATLMSSGEEVKHDRSDASILIIVIKDMRIIVMLNK